MYRSQQLALKYLTAAIALFGVMTIAGLMSAYYYINSNFLFGLLDFNIAKILHIDTLIIWLLMGFMGAIYWFLPEEFGIEIAGIRAAEVLFYVFCAVVAVVAAVFIFVQYGGSDALGMWLVNQGRKYVEAPRWAATGVVIVMLVFAYNVIGTAIRAKKMTGIMAVLIIDLVPLIILYLNAFAAYRNMSEDLYWWWWLVHLWVEGTWEVLIGCIMALALMIPVCLALSATGSVHHGHNPVVSTAAVSASTKVSALDFDPLAKAGQALGRARMPLLKSRPVRSSARDL